ncbi:MAG: hypothetical protein M1816_002200 [Peltula sp. TS41687]|nr:MAG: hypothetical protein M1816_002200 [Peltula sp. TS41687]
MLTEYHELDPRGDVQLVLKSHSTPYKIPDDPLLLAERDESPSDLAPFVQHGEGLDEPADAPVEVEEITSIEVSAEAVDIILEPEEVWAATEDALVQDASTEPEASDDVVTLADSNHLDAPRDNSYHGGDTGREGAALAGSVALQGGRETPDDIGSEEMRMRVSSKHLTLASSQFERMFQGDWREGNTLRSAGSLEVPLPGDDPAAMLILMNIIHGRTRKVPRLVDLETLTRLAILIDYYQFHEAVEVFSDMWVDGLKEQLPRAYTKDLVRWICVSWVLRKPREFGQVTRTAQRQAKGVVATYGLPIPDSIVG